MLTSPTHCQPERSRLACARASSEPFRGRAATAVEWEAFSTLIGMAQFLAIGALLREDHGPAWLTSRMRHFSPGCQRQIQMDGSCIGSGDQSEAAPMGL